MPEQILTREFSICLLPDDDTARDIEEIRQRLPESPYRDDPPHITLLRGIVTESDLSDEALVNYVDRTVSISDRMPFDARVKTVANKSNQFYTASGVMLLDASPALIDFRAEVAHVLTQSNCTVEPQELETFMPHVTIRLGVPLEGDLLSEAEELFKDRTITFSQWLLFRLVTDDDKRIMHEARPRAA